ncbi:MAG: potassium transporter TrkH [Phycisphaerales bacterium]|nr:potassium transporter TrkH [Phycisphaerales bacterium]
MGPALTRLLLIGLASAAIAVEHGFYEHPLEIWVLRLLQVLFLIGHAAVTAPAVLAHPDPPTRIRGVVLFGVLVMGAAITLGGAPLGWRLVETAIVLRFFVELWATNVVLSHRLTRPEALFPLSFMLLIAVGALLLKLPRAVPQGDSIGWVDALFTSTSAVCVTGLAVRNTAHGFTVEGQVVICLLIQLGGLGIIMFGSTLMMLLGRNLSLRENQNLSQMLSDQPVHRLLNYGRFVLVTTVLIELTGAALLYARWDPAQHGGLTPHERIWLSVFHSISAFCNAGFDITGSSLEGYRHSFAAQGVLVPLIVLGGLGFPVLDNLLRLMRARLHRRLHPHGPPLPKGWTIADSRLSLHSRLVLSTTAWLYLYGFFVIGLAQFMPLLEHAHAGDHLTAARIFGTMADASFMSVTARTAGFNSVPMHELEPASIFALMTLMLVGGSPGSTAGGMKTTTLAVLVLSVVATMRQRREAEAYGRSIADALVRKAGTLGVCYFALIVGATVALSLVEPFDLEEIVFEVISAATTTGLSLGITPLLTPLGKLVIIAAMFLGRVGPLALLTVLIFGRRAERPYSYAHEGVALG